MTIQQAIDRAMQLHQAGRFQEAESLYRQVLAQQPNHPDALHLLGVLAGQVGRLDLATDLINQAIAAAPGNADYHCNLGFFLQSQGRIDQAIASFQRAIEIKPDMPVAHNNLGIALTSSGQLPQAIASCQRAIEIKPDYPEAHYNLGNAFLHSQQFEQAIACYQRALQIKPNYPEAYNNLGNALCRQGRLDQAVANYQRAVRIKPDFSEAYINLGAAWVEMRQFDQAVACCRQAIEIKPDQPGAFYNLGNALCKKDQLDQAVASYQRALALKGDYADALSNLGNAWKEMGQLDEAIACFRKTLELNPQFVNAHDNLLYTLCYHPASDAQTLFIEGRRWNQQHAQPLKKFIRTHDNDQTPDRPLRVGYVSPDFRNHPVGRFVLSLLAAHDRKAFQIFCYANVASPDETTAKMQTHADAWRSIVAQSDEQAAEMIRQDRIDILVDLALHASSNRLLIFARKPAPVQVSFASYPGSTGLETIDYRLTDPYLDPPGLMDQYYSEKSIRLPDTWWCDSLLSLEPAVNALPAESNGYVTFGCLNNFCKVNDAVLSLWAKVLSSTAGSRLLLLAPGGTSRQRVLDRLGAEGIAAERVQFVPRQPGLAYLQTYHRIDIGLDTLPYNGHATSFDSFWMGVAVITLVGQTVVGRAGLSQLTNLGLPELIAHTPNEFVRIATDLAGDLPRMRELRSTLRQRMRASPLMDADRFARGVESAYREMWRIWCQTCQR
jgi:predicted O-linked N-acetylglucosamine transferase (SPINDLY family)